MMIHALEIPNDDAAVPRWLEQQLAGADLPQLVAELRSVQSSEPTPALQDILGPTREIMLEQGFAMLSHEQRGRILSHPELLYELQELVYSSGGAYWLKLLSCDSDRRAAQANWPRVQQAIDPTATPAHEPMSRRSVVAALISLAAALLVGFFAMNSQRGVGTWGWNEPGVFDVSLAKPAYLNHLADKANQWYDTKPATAPQLAARMREFRESCDKLIAAPHPQLAAADREWLREKCALWSDKIDASLAKLQEDPEQVAVVRSEIDETVDKLMSALRERAKA